MTRTLPWILTALLSAAAGATAVLVFVGRVPAEVENESGYICPMHAAIVSVEPARCSVCGMELVPVAHEPARADDDAATVTISPNVVNSLGVRTLAVERRRLPRRVETVGYVEYDRTRLRYLFPPADGQIERLSLSSAGERVKKGQFLFQLFSPMLGSSADKTYAQQDGVVVELNIIEGSYVNSTTRVMTLADLDTVWVVADVFEGQASWVEPGQAARVWLPYVAGRSWEGSVEYVYANLDPVTRTLKVRLRFENPEELLKPNMHADVMIDCGAAEDVLAIPRDAVIETEHEQRVVLALGEGRFQPREIDAGVVSGDWVEVTSGLDEGDLVVVSSQFLIDSEANLQLSLRRMAETDTGASGN